jgi:hypothetical protein
LGHIFPADGVQQERHGQVQFNPVEPLATLRIQRCSFACLRCDRLPDIVLRIIEALTERSWQDSDDNTFCRTRIWLGGKDSPTARISGMQWLMITVY